MFAIGGIASHKMPTEGRVLQRRRDKLLALAMSKETIMAAAIMGRDDVQLLSGRVIFDVDGGGRKYFFRAYGEDKIRVYIRDIEEISLSGDYRYDSKTRVALAFDVTNRRSARGRKAQSMPQEAYCRDSVLEGATA